MVKPFKNTKPVSNLGEIEMERKLLNNVNLNLLLLSLFFLCIFPFSTVQAELVAYWSMDELEGRRVIRDTASGGIGVDQEDPNRISGRIGMCHGDPNQVSGQFGSALQFDGVDDYVSIQPPAKLQYSSQIAVSFWLKADPLEAFDRVIISKGKGSWRIACSSMSPGVLVFSCGPDTRNYPRITSQTQLTDNTWHHIVAVNDGSDQLLYIDGVLERTVPVQGIVPIVASRHPIMIGKDPDRKAGLFAGTIDELALFGQALSFTQIQELYKQGITSFLNSVDVSAREAVEQERKMIQPHMREILPRIRRNDITGAETETNRLLGDFANNPEAYPALQRIAEEYLRAEKWDQALTLSEYVLANSSRSQLTSLGAWQTKIVTLIQRGQERDAQLATDELLRNFSRHPYTATVVTRLAERWFNKQKYEQARQYFQTVLDTWPEDERAGHCQYMIARCYAKLKATEVVSESEAEIQMQAAYQKVITDYPDSQAARAASREIRKK
jgi:outer membrane protein assembly factor BamD (BamD/ComL family)